ncbi:MAG: hypothetical protein OHK0015_29340 [Chloroflexi bacterium OHK40]
MPTEMVTLRPVTAADTEALATLIGQLYHAEEPGILRCPPERQARLFRYLVGQELAAGIHGRFLAVDDSGAPIGTASVRFYSDGALGPLPAGLLLHALRAVGPGDTLRFFSYLLRGSLASETPLRRGECYIYSVVVAATARGRGVGRSMMAQLEGYARQAGARAALLRVMAGNERARRLYHGLGYRTVSRPALLARWLGLPSELMRKELG